jgi:glycosyltransferase involved in cell wall biosynthesis
MKRPDLVVSAMEIVAKRYPKAKLAVIGYGPMEQMIQRQIQQLRLEKSVHIVNKDNLFFDASPKDQKVKLMQQAWALILPSVKEGWGMVVTEAGACQTPTIGTRVSGLVDSVIDGKTGILLSPNPSAIEVAEAMIRVIQDTTLRNRLSNAANIFARTLTWEKSYKAFQKLILKPR